jgi:HSP20 family protein
MTTLVRWEPFRELASLQGEMGRLMSGLIGEGGRTAQSWVPALDVWETESELVYSFDLPGIPEEKIDIEVQDETLTVSAERDKVAEESGERFYRFERRYGTFSRAVGLPQGVDESKIAASYKDGVLEVRVPKPEEAKPRRISLGNGSKRDIEGTTSAA